MQIETIPYLNVNLELLSNSLSPKNGKVLSSKTQSAKKSRRSSIITLGNF